jgi:hypothetical protein
MKKGKRRRQDTVTPDTSDVEETFPQEAPDPGKAAEQCIVDEEDTIN